MASYGFSARQAARRRRGTGGTPTPSPTPTPGPSLPQSAAIVAHWSASDIAPQADNSALPSWTEGSANALVASVPSGQTAPKYRTSGIGGKPAVEFTGTQMLSIPAPGALKTAIDGLEYTVLLVADNITAAANACLFGTGVGGDNFHMLASGSDIGRFGGALTTVPFTSTGYISFGTGVTATNGFGGSGGGNLQRFYARGAVFSSAASAGKTTGNKTLCIGAGNIDASATFFFKGRLYRVVVWNRFLTPAEVQQAEAYFNAFYGQAHPAVTAGKMLHIDGDSRHVGVGATTTASIAPAVAYKVAQGLSLPLGAWSNYAVGGIGIQSCINKGGEIDAAAAAVTGTSHRLLYEEFFNSRGLSVGTPTTSGTMAYQTKQYADARRAGMPAGLKIVGATPCDHANVNTPAASGWATYLQANWATIGFDAIADVWATELGGDSAFTTAPWTTVSGTTGYDGVHLSSIGQTIQANCEIAACTGLSGF